MTQLWVDTDMGFDDLWALLVLRHFEVAVAGVSLVAGNAPLGQVTANATGAAQAYGLTWPIWRGAAHPLQRTPETAQRILGPKGMRSRGQVLPDPATTLPDGAVAALANWLAAGKDRTVLALGPLTNIAHLITQHPIAAQRITRLVWMGGSNGPGNHSKAAEFNALADPEALAVVAHSGVPLDIVDLMMCRQVAFGPQDLPATDPLTADLLGGYLDIALERGRAGMAIYDPLAAMAVAVPGRLGFAPHDLRVITDASADYGATRFAPNPDSRIRLATGGPANLAHDCLSALTNAAPSHRGVTG